MPGSHKGDFDSPFLGQIYESAEDLPQGIVDITPKAGDVIVVPKPCLHGVLRWNPTTYQRRVLILRYSPPYMLFRQASKPNTDVRVHLEDKLKERVEPETLELLETTWQ